MKNWVFTFEFKLSIVKRSAVSKRPWCNYDENIIFPIDNLNMRQVASKPVSLATSLMV